MQTILLTNDDGIHAPGLLALERAARAHFPSAQIIVVAPAEQMSECSHRVTTRDSLTLTELDPEHWAVGGSPADCVRLALFAMGLKPVLVLSGINQGGNLGQDVMLSGTVAAAREAGYHGVRAVAFSHYVRTALPLDWERAGRWVTSLLGEILANPWPGDGFWNVNLPHLELDRQALPGRFLSELARSPLPVLFTHEATPEMNGGSTRSYRFVSRYAQRPRDPGSDVERCFEGSIPLTFLPLGFEGRSVGVSGSSAGGGSTMPS